MKRVTPTQSYLLTVKKFEQINATMDEGAEIIRQLIQKDLAEFTQGAKPSGKARKKWLRRLGHPYGRGASAADSTPFGRKRGAARYKRGKRKGKLKGRAPNLPIGTISGNLYRARYVSKDSTRRKYVITAGFNKRAGGALFAVLPEGTRKMVGRNLWGKGDKGKLGQRVKMYRKAFRDRYRKLITK
jgi:hypothetical protein